MTDLFNHWGWSYFQFYIFYCTYTFTFSYIPVITTWITILIQAPYYATKIIFYYTSEFESWLVAGTLHYVNPLELQLDFLVKETWERIGETLFIVYVYLHSSKHLSN